MAGSFGVTSVLSFYKALVEQAPEMQFIVITGRNIKLFANLEKVIEETGMQDNTKLLYFVKMLRIICTSQTLLLQSRADLPLPKALPVRFPWQSTAHFRVRNGTMRNFTQQGCGNYAPKKTGADDIVNLVKDKENLMR